MLRFTRDLVSYIQLSFILGLPWLFGFITPVLKDPNLWYIFNILLCLQGPMIFLSFIWNNRVIGLWRIKLGLVRKGSNSQINTGSADSLKTKQSELSV